MARNAISYSMFGYNQSFANSFPFMAYLRLFSINLKMSELIYPGWRIVVHLDEPTYESEFREFFDYHVKGGRMKIEVLPRNELCWMMMWRLRPVFTDEYQYVICRDVDSLLHYREHQAVHNWIMNGRGVHAITDSPSHNLSLLGGMCGFKNPTLQQHIHCNSWDQMMAMDGGETNWATKGSDQFFMNKFILPRVDKTIVEHYIAGMPNSWRDCCYNTIQNDDIPDVREEMRESTGLVEHIGQAGFIIEPVLKFIDTYMNNDRKDFHIKIDEKFPQIHYWLNDK